MFSRFKKHSMWGSIVKFEKAEVKISIIVTLLITGLFILLDIRNNFLMFKDALQSLVSGFIAGFMALLGFSISAVAVVTTLFNKKDIKKADNKTNEDIESFISSFEYLGLVTAITIISLSVTYIIMEIEWPFHPAAFYITALFIIYLIIFTIFYTISLVNICIKLYYIKIDIEDEDE